MPNEQLDHVSIDNSDPRVRLACEGRLLSATRRPPAIEHGAERAEQKGKPITSFARQQRKEFRGGFKRQPLQTINEFSRRAHRSSVSTRRTGCERPLNSSLAYQAVALAKAGHLSLVTSCELLPSYLLDHPLPMYRFTCPPVASAEAERFTDHVRASAQMLNILDLISKFPGGPSNSIARLSTEPDWRTG